jgi:HAD superfamily hydrolase (TIGR01509 family)
MIGPNGVKVVAFDCDGVMFDSTRANKAYYNQVLTHFGKEPMTDKQFAFVHMHTVDESIAFLFGDQKSYQAAQAYRQQMNYQQFIPKMEIEPDLKALIGKLRPTYATAIATNRTDSMRRVLATHGLEGFFDLVVTTQDVDKPKPHPDQLLKIMDHFQVNPQDIIYIGDSKLDELAAKAAGVPLVAYNNLDLDADFHVNRLHDVWSIVNNGFPHH